MKTAILLLSISALWGVELRAATVSFSNIPATNVVKATDLLLLDSALGGTNYSTRTLTVSNLANVVAAPVGTVVASVTPASTNTFFAPSDLTGTNAVPRAILAADIATSIVTGKQTNATLASLGGVAKSGDTMTGTLAVTGLTNSSRSASTFVVSGSDKADTSTGSSAMLASTLSDETGTGVAVFGTSPVITTPTFNTSITLTNNATGTNAVLVPDSANSLALRNGNNQQNFYIYNSYTDAANYERINIGWLANGARFYTQKSGSGASRNIDITSNGTLYLYGTSATSVELGYGGSTAGWRLTSSGHLITATDNSFDIGASGATRPRSIYAGTSITVPVLNVTGSIQSGVSKVCTSATSNSIFWVSVPNTNAIGGRVIYTLTSTDGTDTQQITGSCQFGAVAKSTSVTANVTDVQNTSTVSAGTLTASITANTSTNNVFAFMVTPTTSLTTTNLLIKWTLLTPTTYTVNAL